MPDTDRPPLYRAYLLRLWEERSATTECNVTWRFSLEDPHTGERHGFATIDALMLFLNTTLISTPSASDPGTTTPLSAAD